MREVKWAPLSGLKDKVLPKPAQLDDSLVGKLVYLRWVTPWGWTLGVITERLTSSTPRLFKKFNYRIKWSSDGSKGPANLQPENYSQPRPNSSLQLVVPVGEGGVNGLLRLES